MQTKIGDIPREISAKLFPSLLTPRPVVIIGTIDPITSLPNLAPFSSISFVANQPPMIAISFGLRRGEVKDTLANAMSSGELVINMLRRDHAVQAIAVAATPQTPCDDYKRSGFSLADFPGFQAGRIGDTPAALGCKVTVVHELPPSKSVLMIAEVKAIYCDDQFLVEYELDGLLADSLASVGGEQYISICKSNSFKLSRTWE